MLGRAGNSASIQPSAVTPLTAEKQTGFEMRDVGLTAEAQRTQRDQTVQFVDWFNWFDWFDRFDWFDWLNGLIG